jgi:predicted small lipoprotein YifL
MKNSFRMFFLLTLSVIILSLTACGAQGNQTPTNDPSTVYTQVAQTVQAQITGNAKLTPVAATATLKPTDPPAATATLRPSSTPFGTGTVAPTSLTPQKTGTAAALPTQSIATVPVVAATQPAGAASADKMQYISQKIADGSTFDQGQGFTMTWVIKNIGSTTWDTNYMIRLFAGDRFGAEDMKFSGTVKPGEQTNVTMDMNAPNTVGEYNSIWVLTNADGRNFGSFTLNIKVK